MWDPVEETVHESCSWRREFVCSGVGRADSIRRFCPGERACLTGWRRVCARTQRGSRPVLRHRRLGGDEVFGVAERGHARAGSGGGARMSRPTTRSAGTLFAGAAIAALLCVVGPAAPGRGAVAADVDYVVDGDTIRLDSGRYVRLIGIDTPEVGECGYGKAKKQLDAWIGDKARLVNPTGVDNKDAYDRLLRYVHASGRDTGLALIRKGLAKARYDGRDGHDRHPRQSSTAGPTAAATTSADGSQAHPRRWVVRGQTSTSAFVPTNAHCLSGDSHRFSPSRWNPVTTASAGSTACSWYGPAK